MWRAGIVWGGGVKGEGEGGGGGRRGGGGRGGSGGGREGGGGGGGIVGAARPDYENSTGLLNRALSQWHQCMVIETINLSIQKVLLLSSTEHNLFLQLLNAAQCVVFLPIGSTLFRFSH